MGGIIIYLFEGHNTSRVKSIGIALHPAHGNDISSLLQNADAAMYHAKEQGKNTYSFFNDDLQIKAAIQLQVESGLPRAIMENELVLHYQPQVELDSGRVVGLEALVLRPSNK